MEPRGCNQWQRLTPRSRARWIARTDSRSSTSHQPIGARSPAADTRVKGEPIAQQLELQAPPDAETHEHYDYVPAEWAKNWPSEEIWVARKRIPQ